MPVRSVVMVVVRPRSMPVGHGSVHSHTIRVRERRCGTASTEDRQRVSSAVVMSIAS
jgi:hypothetical protein